MHRFIADNGTVVTGEIVEYFAEAGEQRVRIRVRNSRVCVTARVGALTVEVA